MDASRAALCAKALGRRALVLALVCAPVLAGCGRGGAFPTTSASEAPDPGYHGAPQLTGAVRAPDGEVALLGRSMPSARLRMVSAAGARIETTADGSGAWRAAMGPVSEPALYRLAAESDGQRLEAEGLVAVMPGAPAVAVLRAGAGAEALDSGKPGLRILAVDYDSGGATVVSGRAPASSPMRILVDGTLAVEAAAGPDGRFSLTLPKPLAPGARHLQAVTPKAVAALAITVTPPAPPKDAPYKVEAEGGGWRIDWVTPGGGPQTTLLPSTAAAG
jgi:hypothetical protein